MARSTHSSLQVSSTYVPTAQSTQSPASSLLVADTQFPATQSMPLSAALVACHRHAPAASTVDVVGGMQTYVLTAQSTQPPASSLPVIDTQLPAIQSLQLSATLLPVTDTHLPTAQSM